MGLSTPDAMAVVQNMSAFVQRINAAYCVEHVMRLWTKVHSRSKIKTINGERDHPGKVDGLRAWPGTQR
jgi:hypothetical protein